jgi:D-lyxose ketol-isomerase
MSLLNLLNNNRKFVSKGWGYEDWIDNNSLYCGKDLFIKKDKKLSLHYHKLKTETFFVQSGSVRLVVYLDISLDKHFTNWYEFEKIIQKNLQNNFNYRDLEVLNLVPGDSFQVPVGLRHTLFANLDSHVYEFSTEHSDDDSYRIIKGD